MSNRFNLSLIAFAAFGFAHLFVMGDSVAAHEIFQDVLKERYNLKTFSCKSCHPDSKDRKLRTPFADRIYKQMKPLDLSEKFAVAEKAEEAAKAKDPDSVGKDKGPIFEFEQMAAKEFKKAFVEVGKQTMTIDEMFEQGLFNGARLDTKKSEGGSEKEDDDEEKSDAKEEEN